MTFNNDLDALFISLKGIEAPKVNPNKTTNDFQAIPQGDYVVKVSQEEIKESKAGNKYYAITFRIIEGEYANRLLFDRLNLFHPNEKAVKFSKQRLKELAAATGKTNLDSINLMEKPFLDSQLKVSVVIESSENYGDQNKITGFMPANLNDVKGVDLSEQLPF